MSKETRNIIIVAIVALLVGYIAGGVMQTGCCPITGKVISKERAAACEKAKACATSCEVKEAGNATDAEAKPADASN
jgi:hypothetical protein